MNMKAVIGVVVVAVFIGVLYVVLEKSFFGGSGLSSSGSSSAQEVSKGKVTATSMPEVTIITLPEIQSMGAPIDESTDILSEAEELSMRDYSGVFEDFKDTVSKY